MNKRDKVIVTSVVLVLLLTGGVAFAASGGDKKDTGKKRDVTKCPPGFRRLPDGTCEGDCPEGFKWVALVGSGGTIGQCVKIDDPSVTFCPDGQHYDPGSGTCVDDDDIVTPTNDEDDDCPEGMVKNLARLRLFGSELTGAALEAELAKYPVCTLKECPPGFERNDYGECVPSDPTPPPSEPCPEGQHRVFLFGGAPEGVCIPDNPNDPFDIDDYIKDYPEDGAIYQMRQGEILGWGIAGKKLKAITQNVLGRALFLAARQYGGLDDAAALAWANARRVNQALTNKIYNAILCCAWNDILYGTWGYCGNKAIQDGRCRASERNHAGEHGRAIRPLTQHANNIERLRQGLNPARVVSLGTPANAGDGRSNPVAKAQPGGDNSYPAFYLPGIDRKHLWDTNGASIRFDTDRALPPDQIWDRGFDNVANAMLPAWGCNSGDYAGRVET